MPSRGIARGRDDARAGEFAGVDARARAVGSRLTRGRAEVGEGDAWGGTGGLTRTRVGRQARARGATGDEGEKRDASVAMRDAGGDECGDD